MGVGGRADFVLVPPTLSEKWALKPRLVWGGQDYKEGKNLSLSSCCQQKSRQRRHASENHIQELCKDNFRRPKSQGYVVPESHIRKHICTFLTFAGRRVKSPFHVNLATENPCGHLCTCDHLGSIDYVTVQSGLSVPIKNYISW